MHFEGHSAVFLSLRKIAGRLDELGIPYAIAGGMALFAHGFRRFTEDVHPLVTPDGLAQIHAALDGLGYVPPFLGSKQLRDGETQVRIEFLVAGQFPGDGRPKPVAFPDPTTVSIEIEGIRYLNLSTTTARLRHRTGRFEPRSREDAKKRRGERRSNTSVFAFVLASRPRGFAVQTYAAATKVRCSTTLIDLKLASGMTAPGRLKDLADVQELIRILALPADFAARLAPYTRDKYADLWQGVQMSRCEDEP